MPPSIRKRGADVRLSGFFPDPNEDLRKAGGEVLMRSQAQSVLNKEASWSSDDQVPN
jgi:hypothetical protein